MPVRACLNLDTMSKCREFVTIMNSASDSYFGDFSLVNEEGNYRINACSMMGVLYASAEWPKIYLVNNTNDGFFPVNINHLREA